MSSLLLTSPRDSPPRFPSRATCPRPHSQTFPQTWSSSVVTHVSEPLIHPLPELETQRHLPPPSPSFSTSCQVCPFPSETALQPVLLSTSTTPSSPSAEPSQLPLPILTLLGAFLHNEAQGIPLKHSQLCHTDPGGHQGRSYPG